MKIAIILGTRPEIIKLAPIIKDFKNRKADFFVMHTGQHYDYAMDKIFFKELDIESPIINLNLGLSARQKEQMLVSMETVFKRENPDFVLVQGDTNSALMGALAATNLGIKVGHVEAGLRSYDNLQPEEHNRIMIDRVSHLFFTPTKESKENLAKEGIKDRVYITGNTCVDSVLQSLEIAQKKSKILDNLGLKAGNYFLATAHRQENIDCKDRFLGILTGIKNVSEKYKLPVVYPVHPRARKMIANFSFEKIISDKKNGEIIDIEPTGFFDFLVLQKNAKLILTDSGGVVEESCCLKVPSVCLRDFSDRPETLKVGASVLAGCRSDEILKSAQGMIERSRNWKNPFGSGNAAKKIGNIIFNES